MQIDQLLFPFIHLWSLFLSDGLLENKNEMEEEEEDRLCNKKRGPGGRHVTDASIKVGMARGFCSVPRTLTHSPPQAISVNVFFHLSPDFPTQAS